MTFIDINECEEDKKICLNGVCNNTEGSYECSCSEHQEYVAKVGCQGEYIQAKATFYASILTFKNFVDSLLNCYLGLLCLHFAAISSIIWQSNKTHDPSICHSL